MKFKLCIDMGNDAFHQRGYACEVTRILDELAARLDTATVTMHRLRSEPETLRDLNGNAVGFAKVTRR